MPELPTRESRLREEEATSRPRNPLPMAIENFKYEFGREMFCIKWHDDNGDNVRYTWETLDKVETYPYLLKSFFVKLELKHGELLDEMKELIGGDGLLSEEKLASLIPEVKDEDITALHLCLNMKLFSILFLIEGDERYAPYLLDDAKVLLQRYEARKIVLQTDATYKEDLEVCD